MTLEENLQHLIECAGRRQIRYSEVLLTCEEALAELDRLREFEFMYQGLCD